MDIPKELEQDLKRMMDAAPIPYIQLGKDIVMAIVRKHIDIPDDVEVEISLDDLTQSMNVNFYIPVYEFYVDVED